MKNAPPLDLCVFIEPRVRFTESKWVTRKWSTLIAQSVYAGIQNTANDVFWAVAAARCECPYVVPISGGGLTLSWEEFNRTLKVRLIPGEPLRYKLFVTNEAEPAAWNLVNKAEKIETIFFRLGRYISGKPERNACVHPTYPDRLHPRARLPRRV